MLWGSPKGWGGGGGYPHPFSPPPKECWVPWDWSSTSDHLTPGFLFKQGRQPTRPLTPPCHPKKNSNSPPAVSRKRNSNPSPAVSRKRNSNPSPAVSRKRNSNSLPAVSRKRNSNPSPAVSRKRNSRKEPVVNPHRNPERENDLPRPQRLFRFPQRSGGNGSRNKERQTMLGKKPFTRRLSSSSKTRTSGFSVTYSVRSQRFEL